MAPFLGSIGPHGMEISLLGVALGSHRCAAALLVRHGRGHKLFGNAKAWEHSGVSHDLERQWPVIMGHFQSIVLYSPCKFYIGPTQMMVLVMWRAHDWGC